MEHVRPRFFDFSSAVILVLALLTVSERLYLTGWTIGLETIPLLTLTGAFLGLALGASRFKPGVVFWLATGYSLPVLVLVLGGILYTGSPWLESIVNLAGRLARSIALFLAAEPVKDTALFIAFLSIGFWTISLTAGYALTRTGTFAGAIVPAGIVLVIIQLYDLGKGGRDALLGIYFFLCLLLLGRLAYARKQPFWQDQHVAVLSESRAELNLAITAAALFLVALAWMTPGLGHSFANARNLWKNISLPIQKIQEDLSRIVAGVEGGSGGSPVISYGESLALGSQAASGESVYLNILSPVNQFAGRYYWRVRTYNVYQDGKWYTEGVQSETFTSDLKPVSLPNPQGMDGRFNFTSPQAELTTLITPPRADWVSRSSELVYLPAQDDSIDPILFRAQSPVLAGESYVVQTDSFEPTINQLRNAGEDYPAWVLAHYTQLPADLPTDVIDLAQQITLRFATPYDMTVAITNYLRNHITYSTVVQSAPAGLDPLAWFLFDTKSGFCNYYASAEVVLLRSVGIPSRLAVGFSQGEFEPPNRYTVLQSDAHAWPEVYFPGLGWVEFEPTVSQPPLIRPLGVSLQPGEPTVTLQPNGTEQAVNPVEGTPTPVSGVTVPGAGRPAGSIVSELLIGLLAAVVVITILLLSPYGLFDKILVGPRVVFKRSTPVLLMKLLKRLSLNVPTWLERWAYFAGLNPVGRSFAVVYRSLRWLGVKISSAQTPARAAAALAEHLPAASSDIHALLREYHKSLYGRESGDLYLARNAEKAVWRTTLRTVFQNIIAYIRK